MDLLPVIRKLLYQEEGLIIPGLGGFVSQYRPAEIHPDTGNFAPPAKEVAFNPDLVQDDGKLATRVSEATGITRDQAIEEINRFVEWVWAKLGNGDRVLIDGVGFFYLDQAGLVRFQNEPGLNLLLDSFGLISFYLKGVQNENDTIFRKSPLFRQEEEEPARAPLPGTTIPEVKNRTFRRLVVAVPLLLIFILLPYNSRVTRVLVKHPATLAPEPSLFRLDFPKPAQPDTVREIVFPIESDTLPE
jgi:nucleoid DNA-binding protein